MKPQKRQLAELRANRVEPVKPITRFVSLPTLESLETGQPIKRDRVSAREPSARELLAEKLQAELEKILPEKTAKSAARKVTGYGYPMGLIDVTPAGIPLWAYEGGQSLAKAAEAAGEGEYGTAAFEGALGALSLAPAAQPAAAGAKAVGKQAAKAIDRAMMTGEGPLGAALAAVRPQFIFVGPKSATWDAQAAKRAEELEKAGKSQDEIWKETKTFRGADGNWRQEISDLGSQFITAEGLQEKAKAMRAAEEELKQRVAQSTEYPDLFPKQLTEAQKLARKQIKESKSAREGVHGVEFDTNWRGNFAQYVLEHPELYEAYPHLKEAVIKQGESGPYKGLMTAGSPTNVEISIYKKGLQDDPRSTALHEMQHAIQTYEGWAPGGNTVMAFRDPKAFEILDELRQKALKPMSLDEYKEAYSGVLVSDAALKREYNKYKKSLPNFVKNIDLDLQQTAAFEYYKRLAGEAEARATQKRAPLSEVGRALIPPEQSFDVPFERQIIKERHFPTAEDPIQAAALAYHGTPHQFEKFDLSKIGTGEGAQAYGHGLYFAESPGVAKAYQSALSSDRGFSYAGQTGLTRAEVQDIVNAKYGSGYLDGVIRPSGVADSFLDDMITGTIRPEGTYPRQYKPGSQRAQLYDELRGQIQHADPGSLYKVDIPDEAVARMLDWDKPLKEQPKNVQAALQSILEAEYSPKMVKAMAGNRTGGEVIEDLNNLLGTPAMTSKYLTDEGVLGIKYLDQGSRGTGEGTRNFVLFSEDLPRILEVNEKPTGAKPWAPGEYGREPYPQAEALETARKNAVEMLGLPENNTPMDRARAMGFREQGFHGTAEDFPAYDVTQTQKHGSGSREGRLGAWLTDDPRVASEFADWSARGQGGNVVYPMMIRGENPAELSRYSEIQDIVDANTKFRRPPYRMAQDEIDYPAAIKQLEKMGDYVALRNTATDAIDKPITQFLVSDPSRLRSRFAAFDPARMNENDLLGYANLGILPYVGGLGALGALGLSQIEEKPKKKGTKNGK